MKARLLGAPLDLIRGKWSLFAEKRLPSIVIFLMVATFVAAVLYPYVVITVPSGSVGVLWKRFGGLGIYCWCVVAQGTVLDPHELRDEGLHIIWPWDRLFLYDLRLQTATQTYNAIAKDGVSVSATINVRFQLKHNSVAQLHKFIGPAYIQSVVQPEIGSRAREVIANYTAEEVYSIKRQEVENKIRQSAQTKLGDKLDDLVQPESSEQFQPQSRSGLQVRPNLKHSVEIFDTLVLGITLPDRVITAINKKIEQLYVAQEYQFRIEREVRESERKRIEAAGIHDFQQIVSQGISESYLRWRGIEATLQLAQSSNSKVVIVGSGRDGLPIILGNMDTPTPPAGGTLPTSIPETGASKETSSTSDPPTLLENTLVPAQSNSSESKLNVTAKPPAAVTERPRSFPALNLSDIKALLSQFVGTSAEPTQRDTPSAGPKQ
jgi:regulator of protease activity HflC (stomatin/prohibitin superfamily)